MLEIKDLVKKYGDFRLECFIAGEAGADHRIDRGERFRKEHDL